MKFHTLIKQFAFLFFLLFPLLGQGQYRVDWADEYVGTNIYPFIDIVEYGGGFYVARRDQNGARGAINAFLRIEKKTKDLKLEKKEDFFLKIKSKKFAFKKFIILNDKLFFLANAGREKGMYRMVLSALDTTTLFQGELQFEFFTKTSNPTLYTFKEKSGVEKIVVTAIDIKKRHDVELHTYILDDKLDITFQHKSSIERQYLGDEDFKIKKMQMDKNNNLFLLAFESPSVYSTPRSKKPMKAHLFIIDTKAQKEGYVAIKMKMGNYLRDVDFLMDAEKMYVLGLYSQQELTTRKAITVKGVFVKQSPMNNLTDFKTKYYPITKKIAHYSLKSSQKKKLEKNNITREMDFLLLKDILFWGDDRVLIVAESTFSSFRNAGNVSRLTTDIVAFACDKKGNLIWMNNIAKKESDNINLISEYPISTSYIMHLDNKGVGFFYQSIEHEEKDKPYSLLATPKENLGFLHTRLKYTDGSKKTVAVDLTNLETKRYKKVCPNACRRLKNGDYLIYGRAGSFNKGKFGIMHLE